MANWQRTLNLLPEWKTGDSRKIAEVAAKRLRALRPFGDTELDEGREEIAERFEGFAAANGSLGEFNDIMSDLYDWADTRISGTFLDAKRACWVKKF